MHVYVIGATRSGKTNYLLSQIESPFAFIDKHGQAARQLADALASGRCYRSVHGPKKENEISFWFLVHNQAKRQATSDYPRSRSEYLIALPFDNATGYL